MQFELDSSQQEFQKSLRKFLSVRASEEKLRHSLCAETPFDERLWASIADELGLQGVMVPEELGGGGGTSVELGIIMREFGYAAVNLPFLGSTVLATTLLLGSGDGPAQRQYIPKLASGELIGAVVGHRADDVNLVTASPSDDGQWTLNGEVPVVVDGGSADVLFVLASTPDGTSWFAVSNADTGVATRQHERVLDPTRRLASIAMADACGTMVGVDGAGLDLQAEVMDHARIALAAEQSGVAARATEIAVEYAKVREQFGRPVGSFQAVKHLCADMRVGVEGAEAASDFGLVAASANEDFTETSLIVAAYCSEVATNVTKDAMRVLGGVGFTWEHPMHFYLKRAKANSMLFGTTTQLREKMMAMLS